MAASRQHPIFLDLYFRIDGTSLTARTRKTIREILFLTFHFPYPGKPGRPF
jgi:hypothetical protein